MLRAEEARIMCRDIATCARLGCDGVVIGALTPDARIDAAITGALQAAAGSLGVTFHRAFDLCPDLPRALDAIMEVGIERILTSGGAADAVTGSARLADLVRRAGRRLAIMPGAGIHSDNIAALAAATGARQFHASAKRQQPSSFHGTVAPPPGLDAAHWGSDEAEIRALVAALSGRG